MARVENARCVVQVAHCHLWYQRPCQAHPSREAAGPRPPPPPQVKFLMAESVYVGDIQSIDTNHWPPTPHPLILMPAPKTPGFLTDSGTGPGRRPVGPLSLSPTATPDLGTPPRHCRALQQATHTHHRAGTRLPVCGGWGGNCNGTHCVVCRIAAPTAVMYIPPSNHLCPLAHCTHPVQTREKCNAHCEAPGHHQQPFPAHGLTRDTPALRAVWCSS